MRYVTMKHSLNKRCKLVQGLVVQRGSSATERNPSRHPTEPRMNEEVALAISAQVTVGLTGVVVGMACIKGATGCSNTSWASVDLEGTAGGAWESVATASRYRLGPTRRRLRRA